jgi:hypothetical protein
MLMQYREGLRLHTVYSYPTMSPRACIETRKRASGVPALVNEWPDCPAKAPPIRLLAHGLFFFTGQ